jgi:hypothetical protein
MKNGFLIAGVALVALYGCKHEDTFTDANGNKVTVDSNGANGGKMTFDDGKGGKTTIDASGDGKSVTIDDGKGGKSTMGATTVTEAELGVPYYPGSTAAENGDLKMDSAESSSYTSIHDTSDGPQKVVDFYKGEFEKAGFKVSGSMVTGEIGTISGTKGENEQVSATCTHDKDKNVNKVMISHITKKGGAASTPSASPSP